MSNFNMNTLGPGHTISLSKDFSDVLYEVSFSFLYVYDNTPEVSPMFLEKIVA